MELSVTLVFALYSPELNQEFIISLVSSIPSCISDDLNRKTGEEKTVKHQNTASTVGAAPSFPNQVRGEAQGNRIQFGGA